MQELRYHIRQRRRPRRGNSWYKDTSARTAATFCGADCTSWDGDWYMERHSWVRETERGQVQMTPCAKCIELCEQYKQQRTEYIARKRASRAGGER